MPLKLNQTLKSTTNLAFQKSQSLWHKIANKSSHLILKQDFQLERLSKEIALMDPRAVLSRGYSIVRKDGMILSSAKSLKKGDLLRIEFYEGKSDAEVK
jgi:exonuclease VII large subunit